MSDQSKVIDNISKDLTWLQKHERIVIVLVLCIAVLFLGNKWINSSARTADEKAAVAKAQLEEQRKINAKNEKTSAEVLAQYQTLVTDLAKQNAKLNQTIVDRNDAVKHQQQVDQTMPLPDLAIRWQQLAEINKEDLKATEKGITISESGARSTVSKLEENKALKDNLKDQQTIIENKDQQITKAEDVNNTLQTQITGLKVEISKSNDTCKKEKDQIKADARKSKRNWFIGGMITGGIIVARVLGL